MDKFRLIELIERETVRLSPEGRKLWEELEFLGESVPDSADEGRMAQEYEIMQRILELPVEEQLLTARLAELVAGLRNSAEAERRGKSGEEHRVRGVINAAVLKDRQEGRAIEFDMTLERAIARLKE